MPVVTTERADEILRFWFADALESGEALKRRMEFWFRGESTTGDVGDIDRQIEQHFGADIEAASRGALSEWARTPRGRLALILLLDQFPRNVFRGSARAFATDPMALELALSGMRVGADGSLHVVERLFFYMPLQHAEDREIQDQSVAVLGTLTLEASGHMRDALEECARFAQLHRDIVRRFGRFPHRNAILGRSSTALEREYLRTEAPDFGQGA